VQKGRFQEIHERHGHISLKILISLPEVARRKYRILYTARHVDKEKVTTQLPKLTEKYLQQIY
jgi:hypothetical protein